MKDQNMALSYYQVFLVYGALVALVYLGTDGFRNNGAHWLWIHNDDWGGFQRLSYSHCPSLFSAFYALSGCIAKILHSNSFELFKHSLSLLFSTNMPRRKKILTACSFFILGKMIYLYH